MALQDIVGSFTPLTIVGSEFRCVCPFEQHAEPLCVIGERFRCFGCGVEGAALDFLRLIGEPDPEGALANGHAWNPTITAPTPKPPRFGLHRLAENPTAAVLIVDHRRAAIAAEQLLPGYLPYSWPDGGDKWGDLEPLRGRTVLLWPSNTPAAILAMQRLAAVLTDPAGVACTGKVIEPTDKPEGWNLASAQAEGMATAEVITWAKAHVTILIPARPEAEAAMPGTGVPPHPSSEPVQSPAVLEPPTIAQDERAEPDAPPVAEFPPEASSEPPKRRRGRLKVVGGADIDTPEPDAEPVPLTLSEAGVAEQFVAAHSDRFRCVHEWAAKQGPTWVAWNGTHWVREPNRVSAWQAAQALATGLKYTPDGKRMTEAGLLRFEATKFMAGFLHLASYAPELLATPETFDADSFMLGCPTCTVNLRTGDILPPKREDYITRRTLVDPMEGATPLFDRVLACATNGEADAENYCWRLFGYFLTGSCADEQFTFLRGDEGSGKGTLVKAIAEILHEYATVSDMEAFTDSRSEKMPQHRAKLEGYRFTYASETNQHRKWNEAQINYMTGRDKVEGQRLYENKRDFIMTAKILIYGNYVPKLRTGIAMGIKRRLHLIQYDSKIAEPDTTLKERLVGEYPAILHRMIRGCMDWQRLEGLCKPERITENVAAYLTDQDDINTWQEECLDAGEHEQVGANAAYQSYKSWTHANNLYCPSGKEFGLRLKSRPGWQSKRTAGGTVYLGYGLKLRAASDEGYPVP